ncbi:hypothetical protein SMACR_04933 [Sordaria macrospora]|uniref:WGS project CABT00000000 data, contig 2.8 n=2 Tax=Sordaria macrospora TaxID=5147 RepID=F7VV73_SORMK|nr:uncharacterized protein SMAC_04933 [Sordaria macrospora k-hell]KAA8628406.1 hypothetical protein SMACR_04933 [Sordaria macrospora]WPJ57529.1 hypothetical protein SMAC4_04933 [Sordaria macrospora]CCC09174.1 unnamed protein product [Sordaria macrospora k-hell]
MSGSPGNCNKWSLVTDGLTCTALASQAGITLQQFLAWNLAYGEGGEGRVSNAAGAAGAAGGGGY